MASIDTQDPPAIAPAGSSTKFNKVLCGQFATFAFLWLPWHSCFGVTAALLSCKAAFSSVVGEMLSGRHGAYLHPTTTLSVLASLSLAFVDL